ncbi:hypothetical protein Lsan_2149 [Legionella santicrucis]|uniref:Uncharacterized protein n=1 Tax=Legionella santicrucis TaxID=45074 RepID=A0A0W0YS55_9GAMM|nr:hypothetical protein [Legionella santicrucis]KTD59724.1 hypothetical protein Lsan_2149 [Legionella santicrucis]
MKDKNEKPISTSKEEFEKATRPNVLATLSLGASLMGAAFKAGAIEMWSSFKKADVTEKEDVSYEIRREDRKALHEPKPHVQAVNITLDKKDISLSAEQAENFNTQNQMEDEYQYSPSFADRERFFTKDQKRETAIAERFNLEADEAPNKFFKEDYTEEDVAICKKEREAGKAGWLCHTIFKAAKNTVHMNRCGIYSDFQFGDEHIDIAIKNSTQFDFNKQS